MVHPVEPRVVAEFAAGLDEIIVVEEKRWFVELAIKDQLYGRAGAPAVSGKRDPAGTALLAAEGELDPDRIAPALARRLLAHGDFPTVEAWTERRRSAPVRIDLPIVRRTPYFCSGVPHNTST